MIRIFILLSLMMLNRVSAQWTNGADIPEGIRAGNAVSHIDEGNTGYIYIIGGRNEQEIISNKIYRYNLTSNSWDTRADFPTPILGSSSVKLGNNIYTIGGMVTTPGTVTKTVYKYSIGDNSWSEVAEFPRPFTDGDAVAYQDSLIYVVGSYNNERTYVYNVNTDKWREGTAVPSPGFALSYGALSVYGDKLIYVGGSNGTFSGTYWNTVWFGEIDQNNRSQIIWTEGTPYPGMTRTFFEIAPWKNGVILIGGTTDNTFDTFTDENYFYNAELNTWTELMPKPTAWNTGNAASIFVDGKWKLVCTGGYAVDYLPNTEIYTQENLSTSDTDDTASCHLKHAKSIGGKNPMLSFCTTDNGNVELVIWDAQGRLINHQKSIAQNAGKHLVSLKQFNLKSGIYFCQLSQNGISTTQKIQIIN
ncbi:Kelch repeat-containing protein [Moheibacter sediminis]|uniref:Por secretion system C-terminal sorting domain-containing protein n=1 Tax=Moheibacter sediminis TaxID=1434700 RepID=A0A1W2CUE7_9FLAO|nr:kelch repeat-containing protein [Moheibacter sediminis]SMC88865.1 Por secretion system C-terminal sorting domain-containing protein [Moheibacter sediminis]